MATKNTLYGPYKSKQAALDATQNKKGAFGVTIKQRYRGLTIGILNDNNHIDEYWFKDGIEDSHLIKKNIEDITELKLDGNKIEKTTFLFSSDLENSESPLMSKINIQISENIQNDTNLQNRVSEAVENSIQNSDTITNAINLGIQGNSTITKFNNLLDGENIKLDALPTALRELPNNFENGVIKDSVLPTGLQKFTGNLSNDGKLATLDVLPTGVITTDNIKDNDIVKGLQGKFDSNGKLVNTVLPTGLQKFTGNLSNDGKINSLDILPTTELTNSILTTDNINSKLPQSIKDFTEKLTNDGKLDIKNLVDGTTPITTDTFAKKTDLSSLSTEFTNLSTVVITTDNIKDNAIVKGLQSKFDSNGKLASLDVLPNGVITETNLDSNLPNTLVHEDTLDTRLANKADSSALNDLQEIAITTNNFNSKIPTGLQKFTGKLDDNGKINSLDILPTTELTNSILTTDNINSKLPENVKNLSNNSSKLTSLASKLDDNGDLDLIKLKLNGKDITKDTLALSTDIPTVQKLLEDDTLASSINDKIINKMQGEEFEDIVNNAISKSSSLQEIVQNGIDNNDIVKGLQGTVSGLQGTVAKKANVDDLTNLQKIAITTENIKDNEIVKGLESKFDSNGKLVNNVLPTGVITNDNIGNNTIVQNLQSKFDSNGKLNVNNLTLPDTVITNDKLDNAGFVKQTDINDLNSTISDLQSTVADKADSSVLNSLRNIAITTENINDNLPANVKELSNNSSKLTNLAINLSNDGKLASLDVLPTGVITTDNIKDNDIVNGLQGTISGLQDTVASKADSSALNDLSNNVVLQNDLNGKITAYVNANDISKNSDVQNQIINVKTELNSSLAKKANSSDLTSLNSTVTTLQSKFNSSQIGPRNAGFVNIETDTTVTDYSDLVKTSINGARIPATMVQSSIAGTETGYYYFLCDSVGNIPTTDSNLKTNNNNHSTNEDYNYVYIINSQKEEIFYNFDKQTTFIDYISNLTNNNLYNLYDLYNNIINELKMNGQQRLLFDLYKYIEQPFNIKIKKINEESCVLYDYDVDLFNSIEKFYLKLQHNIQGYQEQCYRINLIAYINSSEMFNEYITKYIIKYYDKYGFKNIDDFHTYFECLVNIINQEKRLSSSKFYNNYIELFDKIPEDGIFIYDIIFNYNNEEYENEYINIFLNLIQYIYDEEYTNKNITEFETINKNRNGMKSLLDYLYSIIQNCIKENDITKVNNYYYILDYPLTKNYFQTVIKRLQTKIVFEQEFIKNYSEENINEIWLDNNFVNIKHYICKNNNSLLLPYTLSFDNQELFNAWLDELKTGSDNYINGYDESNLKYFGTSEQVEIMLSCYTYEIIPDDNNSITTKINENDVISYITQNPKTQTIYLAFDNDNGWKYFYRQYIWDGEKVLKFKEDLLYEVQYSTPTINTLRGNIENQQENINTITQDSEYNLESIAQTLNGLIDDLLLIKGSLNLSSDITSQLKVLQDATQKMSYDSVTKRYQSNVITTTGKLNQSLNVEQIKRTLV